MMVCARCKNRFTCPVDINTNACLAKRITPKVEDRQYEFWAFVKPIDLKKMSCVRKKIKVGKRMIDDYYYGEQLDITSFNASSPRFRKHLLELSKTIKDADVEVEY